MNKKGFTLTELLATIAILAVVSLVGTVSIMGVRAQIEANVFDSKLQLAMGAAKSWGQDNKGLLSSTDTTCGTTKPCAFRTFTQLMSDDYLEADEEDVNASGVVTGWHILDNAKKDISSTKVKIYSKNGRIYACISGTIQSTDAKAIEKTNQYKCS